MPQIPPVINGGYVVVPTASKGSIVLRKGETLLKLTKRNSLLRAVADYGEIQHRLAPFGDAYLPSNFGVTAYKGDTYTVTAQKRCADGRTVADFCSRRGAPFVWLFENSETGKRNARLVLYLIDWLIEATSRDELYPDPVGWPTEPFIKNSRNMLVEPGGRIVLCDVGLSPHADILARQGLNFYGSQNVINYRRALEIDRGQITRLSGL